MPTENRTKSYLIARIVCAKLFIDSHYLDDIDVLRVAREACFSKFHFLRLFKKTYRITPHQYLTMLRIEKAKQMLGASVSATETCFYLGFDSMSSFIRLFKRHVNTTPAAYAGEVSCLRNKILAQPLDQVPLCFIEYLHWDK
jgi:AraC-like DNA-binding protein